MYPNDDKPELIRLVDELLDSIAIEEEILFEKNSDGMKKFNLNFLKQETKKLKAEIENAWFESQSKYNGIGFEVRKRIKAIEKGMKEI